MIIQNLIANAEKLKPFIVNHFGSVVFHNLIDLALANKELYLKIAMTSMWITLPDLSKSSYAEQYMLFQEILFL